VVKVGTFVGGRRGRRSREITRGRKGGSIMGNRRMLELMLGRRVRGHGDADAPRAPSEGRDAAAPVTTQAPPPTDR